MHPGPARSVLPRHFCTRARITIPRHTGGKGSLPGVPPGSRTGITIPGMLAGGGRCWGYTGQAPGSAAVERSSSKAQEMGSLPVWCSWLLCSSFDSISFACASLAKYNCKTCICMQLSIYEVLISQRIYLDAICLPDLVLTGPKHKPPTLVQ